MQSIVFSAFSSSLPISEVPVPSYFPAPAEVANTCQAAWRVAAPFRLPSQPYLEQIGKDFQHVHYLLQKTEGCPKNLYGRSLDEARVAAKHAVLRLDPNARVAHIGDLKKDLDRDLDVALKCKANHVPQCGSSGEIFELEQAAGALQAALLMVSDKCATMPQVAMVVDLIADIGKCRHVDELKAILHFLHSSDNLSSSTVDALRPALAFVHWRLSESFDYPAWVRNHCSSFGERPSQLWMDKVVEKTRASLRSVP